jgi:hypothetical protein
MAKYPLHPPRKRRTREHLLADLSANHVARFALQCGFAAEELRQDYGLDLAVFTFDDQGYLESGVIWMQLKATDQLKTTRDSGAVLVRLDRRDILAWIAERYPVILVVYDAKQDCAYWLSIHSYFGNEQAFNRLRGKTVTIPIPTANRMSEIAMRDFAREKAALLVPRGEPT